MMKKIILLILLIFMSAGCSGPKIFKSRNAAPSAPVPNVVESFEAVDTDKNGTINREEYYSNSVSINTDQPTSGLGWIILAVIICTFGSAFVYRKQRINGVCKCK
tara:strand:+ start:34687 stop:35001 length:315 start_codon:yes stop_codon:yes gene_type:complete